MSNTTPRTWWGNAMAVLPHGLAYGVMFIAWISMAFVYITIEPWIELLDDFGLEPAPLTEAMSRAGGFLGENVIICALIWSGILIVDCIVLKLLSSQRLVWGIWYGVMMVIPIVIGLSAVYALRILPRHQLAQVLKLDILPSVNDQPALTTTLLDQSLPYDERFKAGSKLRTLGQIAKTKVILPLNAPVTDVLLQVAADSQDDLQLRTSCAVWTHDLLEEGFDKPVADTLANTYVDALGESKNAETRETAARHAGNLGRYAIPVVETLISALDDPAAGVQTMAYESLVKLARVSETIRANLRKVSSDNSRTERIRESSGKVLAELGE